MSVEIVRFSPKQRQRDVTWRGLSQSTGLTFADKGPFTQTSRIACPLKWSRTDSTSENWVPESPVWVLFGSTLGLSRDNPLQCCCWFGWFQATLVIVTTRIFTVKTLGERIASHADVDWLSSWHRSTFLVRGKLILRVYGTAARRRYSAGGCSFERWSSSGAYPPLRRRSSSFQGRGADNSSPSSCVISAFADLETFSFLSCLCVLVNYLPRRWTALIIFVCRCCLLLYF